MDTDSFDFEDNFDLGSDFENENGIANEKMISEILKMQDFYNENKELFDKMASKMKSDLKNRDPLVNPMVVKTISELKSFLKSKCEIEEEEMELEFLEAFNHLILEVKTPYLGIPPKFKKEFDQLFLRCSSTDITTLMSGKTQINFGFEHAYIFTKPDTKS